MSKWLSDLLLNSITKTPAKHDNDDDDNDSETASLLAIHPAIQAIYVMLAVLLASRLNKPRHAFEI